MGVADAADSEVSPGSIECEVGGCIGGRAQVAIDDGPVCDADADEVGDLKLGVVDAAGFNVEDAPVSIQATDIAPGEVNEAAGSQS